MDPPIWAPLRNQTLSARIARDRSRSWDLGWKSIFNQLTACQMHWNLIRPLLHSILQSLLDFHIIFFTSLEIDELECALVIMEICNSTVCDRVILRCPRIIFAVINSRVSSFALNPV